MNSFSTWLAVAFGGMVGALARHALVLWVASYTRPGFPWGVLLTNVSGCLLAGVIYVFTVERVGVDPFWRMLLAVGFLGAFTTFSAFTVDTFALLEHSGVLRALANVAANVLLCLTACAAGLWLARQLQ